MSLERRILGDVERASSARTTPATEEQVAEATELVLAWVYDAGQHDVTYDDLQAVTHLCGAAVDVHQSARPGAVRWSVMGLD